ncbi:peroxisomal oxidase [Fomitiporia mediterranea MF3/22]|uniref:peroxisomal oxidase n=1 Tax=Fomitiporia mediterranea (strain MF3/22) TaxID=694068 RepID=UPI0004407DA0|nr:peroxisomal oxidase [Fomitiporia mediterranea MF3/22]EJD04840.1 peroxisomal oxidase [Fomitiporia mediterranea MF3/22]
MTMVDCNAQTALDIEEARRNAKLNVPAIRAFLHGGEDAWKAHERVEAILSKDPVFDKSRRYYMTRKELYIKALAMQKRIEELREIHHWDEKDLSFVQLALDEGMPMYLTRIAFEPVVMSQGSEELKAKYGALIKHRAIIGAYLQTELAHGTNVAQLETTATYLPEAEEFEIHSPTLTSTKWWIGALGKTANYGVVQARLILPGGKDMGPHLFFIQLRSLDTHEVLSGIKIGDIGPKAMGGLPGLDNGYARFDHVRIPRSQMLSKFAQVTKDGKYVKPPHAKLSYGGMLYIRSTLVTVAGRTLAKAATISLRYATVRRQGNKGTGDLERQVITYPSAYVRLLPVLSRAYVYILLGRNLINSYLELSGQLSRGETNSLPDMHIITSGLKVLTSTACVHGIEVARRSMGGHGYSAYAGLGKVYAEALPSVTYEGDNFVLDQQVVRAVMKAYNQGPSSAGQSTFAFLRLLDNKYSKTNKAIFETLNWKDWKMVIEILEWRAALAVETHANALKAGSVDGSCDQRVLLAVMDAYVATQVGEMIRSLDRAGLGSSKVIIESLLRLYLLSTAEAALVDLLSLGAVPAQSEAVEKAPVQSLRLEITRLCAELVPEAISLSDAFGFTDWELDSALGVYDGRVYDALWARVQTEPLNQSEITEGYQEFIKPLFERGRALASRETKAKL